MRARKSVSRIFCWKIGTRYWLSFGSAGKMGHELVEITEDLGHTHYIGKTKLCDHAL